MPDRWGEGERIVRSSLAADDNNEEAILPISLGSKRASLGGHRLERLEEGLEQHDATKGGLSSSSPAAAAAAAAEGLASGKMSKVCRNGTLNGTLGDADLRQLDEGGGRSEILVCGFLHRLHRRYRRLWNRRPQLATTTAPVVVVHGMWCKAWQVVGWSAIFAFASVMSLGICIGGQPTLWLLCAALIGALFQLPSREAKAGACCMGSVAIYVALIYKAVDEGTAAVLTVFYLLECLVAVAILRRMYGRRHPLFTIPRHVVILVLVSLGTTLLFGTVRSAIYLAMVSDPRSLKQVILDDFSRNWFAVCSLCPLMASASITRTYNWLSRTARHSHRTKQKLAIWAAVVISAAGLPIVFRSLTPSSPVVLEGSVMTSFPIMLFAGVFLGIPGSTAAAMISVIMLAIVIDKAGIWPNESMPPPAGFTAVSSDTAFGDISRIRLWRTIFAFSALYTTVYVGYTARVLRSVESQVKQQTAVIQTALDDAARARDAERDANRHKAGFLAFLCHELRNPLHAILNMSTFLLEEISAQGSDATQDMDRSAQAIGLASEYMLSLINDTLDMGRFEAGEVHLHRVHVEFRRLLEGTFAWARELVNGQDVHIVAVVDDNVPTWIIIDPVRSQQIINNLIINAYKFSPPHSSIHIHVTAQARSTNGFTHRIRVAVTDMGPSLTLNQVALLFQPYAIHTSASREYGGSGLGLAITNQISQLMGGRIECEPAVSDGKGAGTGSVFTFILPVTQVDEHHAAASPSHSSGNVSTKPILLAGKKSIDRNVAAARFDQVTKLLNEQPLVGRASDAGLDAKMGAKKTSNPLQGYHHAQQGSPKIASRSSTANSTERLARLPHRAASGLHASDGFEPPPSEPSTSPRASFSSFDNFPDSLAREIRARLIDDDGDMMMLSGSAGGQRRSSYTPRLVRTLQGTTPGASNSSNNTAAALPSTAPIVNHEPRSSEPSAHAPPFTEPLSTRPPVTDTPLAAESAARPRPPPDNAILVVDDSGINRRILCRHLSRLTDMPIHQAADGQEAITTYGALDAPTYSIIFMDRKELIMMPNVDGHEATRRIRNMGCTAPIVATTASVVPGEEVQAMMTLRECGMSQALPKPFTKEQIEDILKAYGVRLMTAAAPAADRPPGKSDKGAADQSAVEPSVSKPQVAAPTPTAGPPTDETVCPHSRPAIVITSSVRSEDTAKATTRLPPAQPPSARPVSQALTAASIAAPFLLGAAAPRVAVVEQAGRIRKSQSADNWADAASLRAVYYTANYPGPADSSNTETRTWVKNADPEVSAAVTGLPPPAATAPFRSGGSNHSLPNTNSAPPSPLPPCASSRPPPPPSSPPANNAPTRIVLNSLPVTPRVPLRMHSDPARAQAAVMKPYVLVVDDSTVSRGILGRILTSIGQYEVHDAINGIEALQRCFWTTYSIIFMDLEMPRMGGQEAAARIRSTGYLGPIIVITSHPLDALPRDVVQVGVTECLAKPISREVIYAVLKRYHLLYI
ncbi:hypothetical protein HDU87_002515 [Geranomyces variabilis]|uniref:Uncharacterized protein n=1 Tax=Geranomyces variabilis TaxID=109894 RepID=A0AAD5TRQ6_9FUNG|nr:hypothetical protein HDU87_002515 [Geranomyces variabilis]